MNSQRREELEVVEERVDRDESAIGVHLHARTPGRERHESKPTSAIIVNLHARTPGRECHWSTPTCKDTRTRAHLHAYKDTYKDTYMQGHKEATEWVPLAFEQRAQIDDH